MPGRAKQRFARIPAPLAVGLAAFIMLAAAVLTGGYHYLAAGLPQAGELRSVRVEAPLQVFSRDGLLIAEFGEVIRTPITFRDMPPLLVDAVLAAEDEHFFSHPGIDYRGVARAVLDQLRTLGKGRVGGSTITQQVARMHYLERSNRYLRKLREWVLALRLEAELSKEEILELYLNTYEFGHRSFGIVAAARTYFGKPLAELSIAETALLAGIPNGPSIFNPISNPQRATERRAYVLRRMRELALITEAEHLDALAEPVLSQRHERRIELDVPYLAEMVRVEMVRRYGSDATRTGLRVTTTLDGPHQAAAQRALREGLIAYDERHGWRGALTTVDLGDGVRADPLALAHARLADYPDRAGTISAFVLVAGEREARVYSRARGEETLGLDAVAWAAPYIDDQRVGPRPTRVDQVLGEGDIVRLRTTSEGALRLAQIPELQSALVALDPRDGAIVTLVGGFNFHLSNFNRAVQSARQPGSAFKPFVYSAALEHGFTPASIVNDAPVVFGDRSLGTLWRPTNDSGRFYGDTRLREALVRSQNLTAVRVANQVGLDATLRHLRAFGFGDVALPHDLTVSLGAGGVAPLDLARAYAVFANGGFLVDPYFVARIEDARGHVLFEAAPAVACPSCGQAGPHGLDSVAPPALHPAPRVISERNAWLMTDMLQDVIHRGTGRAAQALGRGDLAGKTGTSNDHVDGWFAGYNADLVATVWVGFDSPRRSLGRAAGLQEGGSRTALPIWSAFMADALAGTPAHIVGMPPGIVELRIDPQTGGLAGDLETGAIIEKFYVDATPQRHPGAVAAGPGTQAPAGGTAGRPGLIF
jgi:penicillin-binding protein 1A